MSAWRISALIGAVLGLSAVLGVAILALRPSPAPEEMPAEAQAPSTLPDPGVAPEPSEPQSPARAESSLQVPSGQPISLQDMRREEDGTRLRFRFVAPRLGDGVEFETAAADMAHLCEAFALPWMAEEGVSAQEVVISMAAQPVPFGEPAPEVTQYFEAYRVVDGRCDWEFFQ